jgi:hypothetical protein
VLLIVIGTSLSALLLTTVLGQMAASTTSLASTRALHAAETGIETAMAQIRAAVDSTGAAGPEHLPPCVVQGALSNGPTSAATRYRVAITYRNGSGATLTPCPPNNIPATARLEATGSDIPGGALTVGSKGTRTVVATYSFKTTNTNIAGGLIHLTSTLCLDAGSALPPPAGTTVQVFTCQSGAARQRFAYDDKLRLRLVNADPTVPGMCVTGDADNLVNTDVTFTSCQDNKRTQVWSLDDSSRFRGLRSPAATLPHRCLTVAALVSMTAVKITDCGSGNQTLQPDDEVGAGRAGSDVERLITGQIVNYEQFGRCLDVTNFVWDRPYMIAWFCKQDAAPAVVRWNQRWFMPAAGTTGKIRTENDEATGRPNYCLRSPGTADPLAYVTLVPCTDISLLSTDLEWTVYGKTGAYATSYRIVDGYGFCLAPTNLPPAGAPIDPTLQHSDGTAKVKVTVCDGTDIQRWNAEAGFKDPFPLTDILEK